MAWLGTALGMFLLLGGLVLGAALAFNVGFGGWLISLAVMELVIVAVIVAVNFYVLGPRH
jgi:hypothetical protein